MKRPPMDNTRRARKIVDQMYENDPFSQWLGVELVQVEPGRVTLKMTVRPEMMNGFGVCHGGITFSFADSALAFAANSRGRVSLLLKASMSYPTAVREGDVLYAAAEEETLNNKVGIYSITVTREDGRKVGLFQGTVYRTQKDHLISEEDE